MQNQEMIEREKFSKLAREFHGEFLVYARSLTREGNTSRDIVQDSFVAAWRNKDKFDVTRDFGSWMRGIIRNKWREHLRKNHRQVPLDDEVLESVEAEIREWQSMRTDGGPSVFMKLEECLSKLPEALLQAVKSFYYDGNSTDEAAENLSIEGSTLRKRLQRARLSLKECVSSKNN
ncbi:MAG: RNA polymerase sigma factor [Akkermansiaceae bacterium]